MGALLRSFAVVSLSTILLVDHGWAGVLRGRVTSEELAEVIRGAQVLVTSLRDTQVQQRLNTDKNGRYETDDLAAGLYEVRVFSVGYETFVVAEVDVPVSGAVAVDVALASDPVSLETVVVSASRRPEKAIDAPASVQVIAGEEVETRISLTPTDHLQGRRGIDVARAGLTQGTVVVRGFNNVFSGATLTLVDHRISRVASLRYNALNLIPITNDDIASIEVVSGPGSALYGPNTANGVIHIQTRSPFDEQGSRFSLAGGNRDVLLVSGRTAQQLSPSLALKVSAQYYQGQDFENRDPVEVAARAREIGDGADPDTLKTGDRDFDLEKVAVDARLDIQPTDDLLLIASGGLNQIDAIELTGLGAAQAVDWVTGYGQLRASWKDLFWQAYVNKSDAGDTYNLRTGNDFVDRSTFVATQVQHAANLDESTSFIYGVDAAFTRPDTDGTINGRNEDNDDINEFGGYLQAESSFNEEWSVVAAARVDTHNWIDDPVFSPRAALVYGPAVGQKLRATYNRAFSTPTPNNLFLDLVVLDDLGDLGTLTGSDGFDVLTKGVPEEGFRFRRDSSGGVGGLYMQIPRALGGAMVVNPSFSADDHVPAVAASTWPAIQQLVGALGTDISGIPAPSSAAVSTVLRVLNPTTEEFDLVEPSFVQDVEQIQPTITNTFEVGYKGVLGRFISSVDVWHRRIEDFVGPLRVETPNVFFDPTSLGAYLATPAFGLTPTQIQTLTAQIAAVPVGTVTPEGATDAADLFLTYRNFGNVDLAGVDLSLTFLATETVSMGIDYSYVSKDFFEDESGDIALNAPQHKGAFHASYSNPEIGLSAGARVRYVDSFPVLSGAFVGDVDSYAVTDASASYDLSFAPGASVTLTVQNLFDHPHREFVGVPSLRRTALLRVTQSFR